MAYNLACKWSEIGEIDTKTLLMEYFWRAQGYRGFKDLMALDIEDIAEELSRRLDR